MGKRGRHCCYPAACNSPGKMNRSRRLARWMMTFVSQPSLTPFIIVNYKKVSILNTRWMPICLVPSKLTNTLSGLFMILSSMLVEFMIWWSLSILLPCVQITGLKLQAGWHSDKSKLTSIVLPCVQVTGLKLQAGWHSDKSKLISIVLLCAQVYKPSGRLAGTQTVANW